MMNAIFSNQKMNFENHTDTVGMMLSNGRKGKISTEKRFSGGLCSTSSQFRASRKPYK